MMSEQVEAYEDDEDYDVLPPSSFQDVLRRTRESYSGWVGRTAEGYLADYEATEKEMHQLRALLRELVAAEIAKDGVS